MCNKYGTEQQKVTGTVHHIYAWCIHSLRKAAGVACPFLAKTNGIPKGTQLAHDYILSLHRPLHKRLAPFSAPLH